MSRSKRSAGLPSGSSIPLAHFFETTYLPLKLRRRTKAYAEIFRGSINWLRKTLRREPLLADFSTDEIAATMRTMTQAGIGKSRIKDVRKVLVRLWQFAALLGMAASVDAPPLGKGGKPPRRIWLEADAGPGTLLWYYRQVFRAQLVEEAGPKECSNFDSAVNHLHDVAQSDGEPLPVLDGITEFTLSKFFETLIRLGKCEDYARAQRGAIARIVRSHDPERFTIKPGPAPKLLAGEKVNRSTESPAEPGTLRHFYENVYLPERLMNAERQTFYSYRRLFSRLRSFLRREAVLSDLTDATAAAFLKWCLDVDSPGTVNHRRALLFAVWRLAHDRDLVQRMPRVKKLKTEHEEPDSWSIDEFSRLVVATDRLHRQPIFGIPAGKYWKALLLVCWYTAMRRRGLFSLRSADVDFERGAVYLRASGAKTKKGKHYILGLDALESLREIYDPARELLFPRPSKPGVVFSELLELAGIKNTGQRLSQFHKIRRTAATQSAIRGGMAAAMSLLDHSGPEVTKRYLDKSRLPANDATQFLPPLN